MDVRRTSEPAAPRHCSLLAHAERHRRRCACFLARRWTSAEKTASLWRPRLREDRARVANAARARSPFPGTPVAVTWDPRLKTARNSERAPRQLGAAVLAAAAAASASPLASVTAALHLPLAATPWRLTHRRSQGRGRIALKSSYKYYQNDHTQVWSSNITRG